MRSRFGDSRLGLLALLISLISLASLAIAGCGQTALKGAAPITNTPTATTAPTATPAPTIPVTNALLSACFGFNASQAGTTSQVGDMLFTQVQVAGLAYPSVMLPDGTDVTHPLKLQGQGENEFTNSPATNPGLADGGEGLTLGVCNISAAKSHTLNTMTAKITSFTGYSGQLSQWNLCEGMVDSHHNLTGGGCGGAMPLCMCFHAPFAASATTGAEVTMTQTQDSLNNPGDHAGTLPLTLAPHKGFFLFAGMDKPSAAGRYTFAFGVRIDGQSSVEYSAPGSAVLLAPVAHKWSGEGCKNNPSMLSQISATNPETYYICPES